MRFLFVLHCRVVRGFEWWICIAIISTGSALGMNYLFLSIAFSAIFEVFLTFIALNLVIEDNNTKAT